MEKKKKCPFKFQKTAAQSYVADCEDDCAWKLDSDQCAITQIAIGLSKKKK